MSPLVAVLAPFAAAALAPWLQRRLRGATAWLLAMVPAALCVWSVTMARQVQADGAVTWSRPWVPTLDLTLSFHLDGLSLLFGVLITGIGAVILVYAGGYLADHPLLGRFYAFILLFMGSMLGVVLAGDVLTLFVFWELTGICSYLLIGFEHEREAARRAALQALLVTGGGGLALLAGLLLLGQIAGTYDLPTMFERGAAIRDHHDYGLVLVLVLAGAFTKSAQWPFHFWLPGAMEAPTPVSGYLHSATMVKAGVYLLARLAPALGGTVAWHYAITLAGATTMLAGALLAFPQTDLKRLLAYSTVSALGTLTLLIGLDTTASVHAAMVFLVVHSLYKGGLFLVTGAVDHAAGTRNVDELAGLRRTMPWTTVAAVLAALAMAGLPPVLGFIGKELLYEAKLQAPSAAPLVTSAGMLANAIMVALAATVIGRPFFGRAAAVPAAAHEAPAALWIGPLLLGVLGLACGLFPEMVGTWLIDPAVRAVRAEPTEVKLALWHGINPVLGLSAATVLAGLVLYAVRTPLCAGAARARGLTAWGPAAAYECALSGLQHVARWQTGLLQNGYLRGYLLMVLATVGGLTGYALLTGPALPVPESWGTVRPYEVLIAGLMVGAAMLIARTESRMTAVIGLGVVGYGMALVFMLHGGPDLAMTQFAVETLSVVLFVLVVYRLPKFTELSRRATRVRDALAALTVAAVLCVLVVSALSFHHNSVLAPYFAAESWMQAHGRNVVNVILVDFRAIDTLGEITVLALGAIGVFGLLTLRPTDRSE